MENSIENRVSMFEKTQGFLNLTADESIDVASVALYKIELDVHVNTILELAEISDVKRSGVTKDKIASRSDLQLKTLKLSTAMMAWDSVDDTVQLEQATNKSSSAMSAMRESDFYVYCTLVIRQAGGVMANLLPFGVAPADLTAAQSAADRFLRLLPGPKNQIKARSKALAELKIKVADTDMFLKDKLDKIMSVYITRNPGLYFGYMSARKIDDTQRRKKQDL